MDRSSAVKSMMARLSNIRMTPKATNRDVFILRASGSFINEAKSPLLFVGVYHDERIASSYQDVQLF